MSASTLPSSLLSPSPFIPSLQLYAELANAGSSEGGSAAFDKLTAALGATSWRVRDADDLGETPSAAAAAATSAAAAPSAAAAGSSSEDPRDSMAEEGREEGWEEEAEAEGEEDTEGMEAGAPEATGTAAAAFPAFASIASLRKEAAALRRHLQTLLRIPAASAVPAAPSQPAASLSPLQRHMLSRFLPSSHPLLQAQQLVKEQRQLESRDRRWKPLSVETAGRNAASVKDLLGVLISTFGGQEVLLSEYALMLAERLLGKGPGDWDAEEADAVQELLKLRFGDSALTECQIMMRDLLDSKRLAKAIQGRMAKEKEEASGAAESKQSEEEGKQAAAAAAGAECLSVDCLLLSDKYWPRDTLKGGAGATGGAGGGAAGGRGAGAADKEPLPKLHPRLQQLFSQYNAHYSVLKKPRHLSAYPAKGSVTLSVWRGRDWPAFKRLLDQQQKQQHGKEAGAGRAGAAGLDGGMLVEEEGSSSETQEGLLEEGQQDEEEQYGEEQEVSCTLAQATSLLWLQEHPVLPLRKLAGMLELQPGPAVKLLQHWFSEKLLLAVLAGSEQEAVEKAVNGSVVTEKAAGLALQKPDSLFILAAPLDLSAVAVPPAVEKGRAGGDEATTAASAAGAASDHASEGSSSAAATASAGTAAAGSSAAAEDEDEDQASSLEDEGAAAAGADASSDPPEAVAVWQQFICGMLSNLGPMPLDRIHNTLKLFAGMGEYPYEKSAGELSRLLAGMAREGTLEQADGTYSLK